MKYNLGKPVKLDGCLQSSLWGILGLSLRHRLRGRLGGHLSGSLRDSLTGSLWNSLGSSLEEDSKR